MFIYHPGKQAELFNYKDHGCELELELEKSLSWELELKLELVNILRGLRIWIPTRKCFKKARVYFPLYSTCSK